jgi:SAM-dependent methyltransferase
MSLLSRWLPLLRFRGSRQYWADRYRLGGNAGAGSFGAPARHKADVLNAFVDAHAVASVIEFGCGDGRQLMLAEYPAYTGFDISADALLQCRERFPGRSDRQFLPMDDYRGQRADLALSLDVIYHLVEDAVYDAYLQTLFGAAERFVVVYSSDVANGARTMRHVRHRHVSADIARRFPGFVRMEDWEAGLPEPVEFNRGIATRFLGYRRQSTD